MERAVDSNNEIYITSLLSLLCSLNYIISISESISEMRHGTMIEVDLWNTDQVLVETCKDDQ